MNKNKPRNFFKSLFYRYIDDEISAMSSQLAYNFLLSLFPFLILLLTILGYSSIKSQDILGVLKNILPNEVFGLIKKTVIEIVDIKRGGLLSLSMITTIWTASNGFNAVIRCLNKAYDEKENRSFIKVQFTSLMCTLGLALIIIISLALLVFGEIGGNLLLAHFKYPKLAEYFLDFARYFIGLIVMLIVFNAVYKYTPSKRLTFKETFPGAVFTTVGWILTSFAFSYYVNHFGSYSKIYGSIGAIIALMSWLYLSSVIILIGGEINATISYRQLSLNRPK
ncbi:YihY/virulence factor BrkB family protein [Candidatus Clostridium radicumherbarum]|uniref:YihY/virulence factor BrkB family protein n=1 Tax=Candidatus Clostridium radicumherbarum TaxID=3381662 RepID=A0ABW8TQG3_9CLOT